jgi:RimJ/RimL family protein N-acetyltransferase
VDHESVTVTELGKADLPFLFDLWNIPEVMRYADEFPGLRGWSRKEDPDQVWGEYEARRSRLGIAYTQLILWLSEDTRIGESFVAPLEEGYTFGRWEKPEEIPCVMGDIKLAPSYWGRGLGTKGMRQIVRWVFSHTYCELFVVPPHRRNPAAEGVYRKAGFIFYTGMKSWRNHRIMELSRESYEDLYA